ncbi:hypothetical protein MMC14_009951 [Varicellaria rhodocarpa]|nr:hypothetical protein [Varicellaria rhodocarpa]
MTTPTRQWLTEFAAPRDFVAATAICVAIKYRDNSIGGRDMYVASLIPIIQQLAGHAENITIGSDVFPITSDAIDKLLKKVQEHASIVKGYGDMAGSKRYGNTLFNNAVLGCTEWKYQVAAGSEDLVPKVAGAKPDPPRDRLQDLAIFAEHWQKWCG